MASPNTLKLKKADEKLKAKTAPRPLSKKELEDVGYSQSKGLHNRSTRRYHAKHTGGFKRSKSKSLSDLVERAINPSSRSRRRRERRRQYAREIN